MKKFILPLLLIWSLSLSAQDVDFDQFSTKIIQSNDGELFSNPHFIDSLIQDKRIILLGELDHGDGTSFELKTELIKYLHEKHGFNKLVFEAGVIDCNQLWESIKQEGNAAELAKKYIYYIWSQVTETKNLFNYIDAQHSNGTPLQIVGIDPQFSGTQEEKTFIDLLKKELSESEITQNNFKEFSYELKIMSEWLIYPDKNEHQITEFIFHSHLNFFKEKILSKVDEEDKKMWELYFENVTTFANMKWEKRSGSFEKRDLQMFNNLKYWLDHYKNEKVIVWAANAHIIRNDNRLTGLYSNYRLIGLKKLGDHIFKEFQDETYSIAVSARTGKTLNFLNKRRTNKIGKNQSDSLEEKLKELEVGLVDLKLFEKHLNLENYESQLFYPNVKCFSKWSDQFDGVLFIDKMVPSTPMWK